MTEQTAWSDYFLPLSPMSAQQTARPAEQQGNNTSPAQPVVTIRFGNVSAAAFEEQSTLPSGKTISRYRVSLRRSYKDRSGEWKQTPVLDVDDLLPASLALAETFVAVKGKVTD